MEKLIFYIERVHWKKYYELIDRLEKTDLLWRSHVYLDSDRENQLGWELTLSFDEKLDNLVFSIIINCCENDIIYNDVGFDFELPSLCKQINDYGIDISKEKYDYFSFDYKGVR